MRVDTVSDKYYYFPRSKEDEVVDTIIKVNEDNNRIIRFRQEFSSAYVEDDKAIIVGFNDEPCFLDIKSKDDATVVKFNCYNDAELIKVSSGNFGILDFYDYRYNIVGWRSVFNVDYVTRLFSETDLFYFDDVVGFGSTIMKYIRCDEDSIYFEDPDGKQKSVTLSKIIERISILFVESINYANRAYDYEARKERFDVINRNATFILLQIIIPVKITSLERITKKRNDLIPYGTINKKQVYRNNGDIYTISNITTDDVLLRSVFDNNEITVEHCRMKDLPVYSSTETRAKRVDVCDVTVFTDDIPVVVCTKENMFEKVRYPYQFFTNEKRDLAHTYYHTENHTFPKDIKTVYEILDLVPPVADLNYSAVACAALGFQYFGAQKTKKGMN